MTAPCPRADWHSADAPIVAALSASWRTPPERDAVNRSRARLERGYAVNARVHKRIQPSYRLQLEAGATLANPGRRSQKTAPARSDL